MGDETKPVCGKKLQTGLAIVFHSIKRTLV